MSGIYDSQAGSRIVQFWIGSAVFFALALTFGVPAWRSRRIAENEREAMMVLKYLSSAEADFRANDRDGNKVNDFWTGDVAGLYFVLAGGTPPGLITRGVAEADAKPLRPVAREPKAFHGYFFVALDQDDSLEPPGIYREDTDGVSGKVHSRTRFGFCAYPAEPGVSGRTIYILNENNSLWRTYNGETVPPRNWPSDDDLKKRWGRPGCG